MEEATLKARVLTLEGPRHVCSHPNTHKPQSADSVGSQPPSGLVRPHVGRVRASGPRHMGGRPETTQFQRNPGGRVRSGQLLGPQVRRGRCAQPSSRPSPNLPLPWSAPPGASAPGQRRGADAPTRESPPPEPRLPPTPRPCPCRQPWEPHPHGRARPQPPNSHPTPRGHPSSSSGSPLPGTHSPGGARFQALQDPGGGVSCSLLAVTAQPPQTRPSFLQPQARPGNTDMGPGCGAETAGPSV